MSNIYDNIESELEMQNMGGMIILKDGSEEVLTFQNLESVPCTPNEMEPNQSGEGYKFCRPNGKTAQYTFLSPLDGSMRVLRSASNGIFFSFKKANVLPDETVKLSRRGSGQKDTRYIIEKMTPEQVEAWKVEHKQATAEADAMDNVASPATVNPETVNPEDIPF